MSQVQSATPTAVAPSTQQLNSNGVVLCGVTKVQKQHVVSAVNDNCGAAKATQSNSANLSADSSVTVAFQAIALDATQNVTQKHDSSNTEMANTKEKTPMCLINELARYNKIQHQYHLTDEDGPAHKKTFTVLLKLGDEEYKATGLSIKKAQHSAASFALRATVYSQPPIKPHKANSKLGSYSPTVELNSLAMKRGEPTLYSVLEPSGVTAYAQQNFNYRGVCNQRYHYPTYPRLYYITLRVGSRVFLGEGITMQIARHNAAEKALRTLQETPMSNGSNKETKEGDVPNVSAVSNGVVAVESNLKSPISVVHEIALKRSFKVEFQVTRESGPPHMRTFVTRCTVGTLVVEGEGNAKKLSKKRAADNMLEELKKLPPLPPPTVKIKKKPNTVKKKGRNLIKEQKANPEYGQGINPISRLIQVQQAKKEKEPVYTLIDESGLPCRREFVMQVQVGSHDCVGRGPNKKLAKRAAAEGLLQILGYSRPQPQPLRPTTKPPTSDGDGEKTKKVTFIDDGILNEKGDNECRSGRQLVPGLLLIPDVVYAEESTSVLTLHSNHVASGQIGGLATIQDSTIAVIAKELLEHGTSQTAEEILKSEQKTCPIQNMTSPKQQLAFLADVLGFTVQFTDFPRGNKREYLSLVSLSTTPPQVSHGAGETLEQSHDQAALTALRTFTELGLDNLAKPKLLQPLSEFSCL